MLTRVVVRLGALQARPRHRSRPDRRGAGHQPQAMGHRDAPDFRVHRRAPARATAPCARVFAVGDEKQSIFSFQGAAPREFDAPPQGIPERDSATPGSSSTSVSFTYSFRSGPAILQCGRRRVPGSRGDLPQHHMRTTTGIRCTSRWPTPRRAWSNCGSWPKPTTGRTSRAGARRSTASPRPARGKAGAAHPAPRSSGWSRAAP